MKTFASNIAVVPLAMTPYAQQAVVYEVAV
jgi:hypothetical protein